MTTGGEAMDIDTLGGGAGAGYGPHGRFPGVDSFSSLGAVNICSPMGSVISLGKSCFEV